MNIRFVFVLTILLSASAYSQKKVVFVIADGIPADVIEKLNTPALHAIAEAGGYTRAYVGGEKGTYSETPTISAVGYNSVLTGTWVNKHNVWDNDIAAPNYSYWNIFRFLKASNSSKKIAIFSSWQDNRTKLVGEGVPAAGNVRFDYHFDGLELDTAKYPHDKNSLYMHNIDEAVVDDAASFIKSDAPDLSWVYLEYTDDMGHMYGDSKEFYSAVEMMDQQVKRLWEAIQYRQKKFGEEWLILITTDHGRDVATGRNHGGQSERERSGWIFTNAKSLNEHFKKGPVSIVDIMPTIARFLDIRIASDQWKEIDGVPLSGKISVSDPKIIFEKNKITLNWKALEKEGKARIWLATTNQFKTGGRDKYTLVGTVPIKKQEFILDANRFPSAFYKLVIEAPHNFLNRWILLNNNKKSGE